MENESVIDPEITTPEIVEGQDARQPIVEKKPRSVGEKMQCPECDRTISVSYYSRHKKNCKGMSLKESQEHVTPDVKPDAISEPIIPSPSLPDIEDITAPKPIEEKKAKEKVVKAMPKTKALAKSKPIKIVQDSPLYEISEPQITDEHIKNFITKQKQELFNNKKQIVKKLASNAF